MSQADPTGFGKFVPGFEFMQSLAKGDNASMAGWIAPTLDPQALDKRIQELKAVQFWLDQNAAALKATLQALEVQKMTLAALQSMNVNMSGASKPAPAAGTGSHKSEQSPPGKPAAGAGAPDPMQFWGALTRQFQQIAADTLKDSAARAVASPTAPAAPKAAKAAAKTSTQAPAGSKPRPAARKSAKRST